MVWYFRHYGKLKKKVQFPLFSLVGGSCPDSFLIFTAPASQQSTSHHPVSHKGKFVFVFVFVHTTGIHYIWSYKKNAVLVGNWESLWLQFVKLRPMNNPSTLPGWKDKVRTFELDKVSLSWLGACWAVLSIAESARRWEFMVPPSSAVQVQQIEVELFGALELRVQQSWEFRASIGRKRNIRSIPSLTHQHHRLWCLELDEKWFDGFAW